VLPTLAERGEDLQALIINELVHLGITHKGDALGIEKAALYRLIQRKYPGNDAELRGILASAAGQAQGPRITLTDLEAISAVEESELPPQVAVARSRARVSPRARRR
jgi:DNA-binding NtrC family response regulator